ncbi:hypothetical protein M378DRAFT_18177 [Amanita muscaria Koide BX008]|uniref:Uncharacterized protein n=1 Tax=Amanita muscaria (strain Koide BX008) TaxID=946122 RepID=A0A0C2WF12_AMAMK|nr:hypothetical protein M378DRAFT_18177 [Amanita muscaria Koide BX008]
MGRLEDFTLPPNSRWNPGGGGVIWQEIPDKLDLEWTWSGHGITGNLGGIFHLQGIQVPGMNREWEQSRSSPCTVHKSVASKNIW